MKYPLIIGSIAAIICFAPKASAKSPAEIERIAKSVSVEIQVIGKNRVGSGVILGKSSQNEHRLGDLYTMVTNRHVVCGSRLCNLPTQENYQLGTADGQKHQVSVKNVKLVGQDLDLAIIQFHSRRTYQVAQVTEPDSLKRNDNVYTAGFPKGQGWLFGSGTAQAVVNRRLRVDNGGYTVVYDAETLPGMSGGGAFDRNGHLVAIHGYGDRLTENGLTAQVNKDLSDLDLTESFIGMKIGINRGIPVRWVVKSLGKMGILVGNEGPIKSTQIDSSTEATTADEFFIAGFNKIVDPGADFQAGQRESVKQFSQAVALDPSYVAAYFLRAGGKMHLKDFRGALADYDQVLSLNPKVVFAYLNRGDLKKDKLNDPQGALADYNQAIALDPSLVFAYLSRGSLKEQQNDFQGALADYNQGISLSPNSAVAYLMRGSLKHFKLNDSSGALADYNQIISLDANFAVAYLLRGGLKHLKLKDSRGALADYNQCISLLPNFAFSYFGRGRLKADLNDPQGALVDYNQAIVLNPSFALAYNNRGELKSFVLNDPQGALADLSQAISLNPKFTVAYVNRGVLKHQKLNDPQGALADYNQVVFLNPKLADIYYFRGNFHYAQGNIAQAEQDFRQLINLSAVATDVKIAQGVLALGQGQLNKAIQYFNQAQQLDPNIASIYRYRGLAYQRQGKRAMAISDWQKAAQMFAKYGYEADYRLVQKWIKG
jgi:tetratricopeptide (TPR) repeat protein